jgi:hypothetical protein
VALHGDQHEEACAFVTAAPRAKRPPSRTTGSRGGLARPRPGRLDVLRPEDDPRARVARAGAAQIAQHERVAGRPYFDVAARAPELVGEQLRRPRHAGRGRRPR